MQDNQIDYNIGPTYAPRCAKYVVKGISLAAMGKSIQSGLEHLGFKVQHESNMISWETKKSLLKFLTILEDTLGHGDILALRHLGYFSIRVDVAKIQKLLGN